MKYPPKIFLKFFRWFCHPRLIKPVEGDLIELYQERLTEFGKTKADLLFVRDVLMLFRKDIIKPPNGTYDFINYGMFRHNFIISIRSFRKFKTTFLINLLGLATGLASALLIYLWILDEWNMDRFQEVDSDHHVQVIYSYPTSGTYHTNTNGFTPNPLYEALAKDLPEVAYSVPVKSHPSYKGIFSNGDRKARAPYQFIGEGYFNIFPGDFIHGDKYQALTDPTNVVISRPLAISLFGSTDKAMGKTIAFEDEYVGGSYTVTGVLNPSNHSSGKFDVLLSYEDFRKRDLMQWYNGGTQAHLVLKEDVDLAQFNLKIRDYLKKVWKNSEFILYAQPYSERYLYGKYAQGLPIEGRVVYLKLFSIIAFFVLLIACINYMNFSTAHASRKIKSIGVKKAIGASRKTLLIQYFGESLFMTFLSLGMAVIIVLSLLPQFNEITGKQLALHFAPEVIGSIGAFTTITGLIAGIYPALYLSGFKPVQALKGRLKRESLGLFIRKGLVVFQFTISVTLIIAVIVIYQQVTFIHTTNLGYNKDHIITFPKEGKLNNDSEAFFTEVRNIPGVLVASQMNGDLPGRIAFSHGYKWEGMSEADKRLRFYQIRGGYDLISLLGITLSEGRDFSKDFPTDQDAYILNETAVKMIGMESPIGEKFGNFNPNVNEKDIIGVVQDFHFQSLQEEVRPFIFSLTNKAEKFVVKIQAGTEQATIEKIKVLYESMNEGFPFEFRFLDENYQALYAAEERITVLSKYFAIIAIVISCLGLLALTSFSTQQRFKEIAIRKVLGSSITGIIGLLSRDFALLVVCAIVLALPVSYFLMKNWLDGFAYRIDLTPTHFISGGIPVLVLALITIITQTASSARVNVTESLKNDG